MPKPLDEATKKQLAARVDYYREMGIYDFYRRPVEEGAAPVVASTRTSEDEVIPAATASGGPSPVDSPLSVIQDKPAALKVIRDDIGDCTRCRLHKGRTNLV